MIINQGMKRQPMAVYRIQEILSGSNHERDFEHVVDEDEYMYQCESFETPKSPQVAVVTPEREAEGSIGYEDGLPVEDFLTKDCKVKACELTNV